MLRSRIRLQIEPISIVLIALLVIPQGVNAAESTEVSLGIDVRCADSDKELKDAKVEIDGVDSHEISTTEGFYGPKPASTIEDDVRIKVEPDDPYSGQTVVLRRRPTETELFNRRVCVYVLPQHPDVSFFSFRNLETVLSDLSDNDLCSIGKGLAFFKRAIDHLDPDDKDSMLCAKYGYAQSLLEGCRNGFDMCEAAKTECSDLLADGPGLSEIKRRDIKVSEKLQDCLKIASDQENILLSYDKIKAERAAGSYKEAAQATGRILESTKTDAITRSTWSKNGKPQWALHRDQAVDTLRFAERIRSSRGADDNANLASLYAKSVQEFEEARKEGDKTTQTRKNLEYSKQLAANHPASAPMSSSNPSVSTVGLDKANLR